LSIGLTVLIVALVGYLSVTGADVKQVQQSADRQAA